ncbi:alcohol dehydrogenase catalytic domain-containing protein [Microbacterium hydrocarbonoxydans]|uniref:alcohol dehydrogenase catalytic domain-containing protein n=1 Tax=Microbacterium hydrocarbonoxydans TaxID=273678 RepID=UPI0007BC2076|nr:alcohol dehydrogenase catalytic domain-containing protein [Microbacterium hydrocarbonoxydans]GAT73695.1 phosphonate catabolism associated alcohol dehydrogenase [Microbacterium sp. HM58-2]
MGTILIRPPGHRRDVALRPAATAMVWIGEGHPHETIAVPGVALADHDVLVAVELSTICGSDVHTVQGRRSAPTPLVLGHESVGRVIATGDGGPLAVDGAPLRIGDRVVWSVTISCGACDRCVQGIPQKCRELGKYGHDRIGVHGDLTGAFGSHVQLRAGTAIVRVPESLPAAVLAPASCATATALAAIARAARHRELEGAAVRIHGAGLVGLSAAAIAAEEGAVVEVLDPNPLRRELAARYGATALDREPDVVIEASGQAVAAALDGIAIGGIVVLVGSVFPADPVPFDAEGVVRKLVTVAGVHNYTGAELAEAVAFLAGRGRAYPFAEAVGEVRQLAEIDEAIAAASAPGAPLRIGLAPGR